MLTVSGYDEGDDLIIGGKTFAERMELFNRRCQDLFGDIGLSDLFWEPIPKFRPTVMPGQSDQPVWTTKDADAVGSVVVLLKAQDVQWSNLDPIRKIFFSASMKFQPVREASRGYIFSHRPKFQVATIEPETSSIGFSDVWDLKKSWNFNWRKNLHHGFFPNFQVSRFIFFSLRHESDVLVYRLASKSLLGQSYFLQNSMCQLQMDSLTTPTDWWPAPSPTPTRSSSMGHLVM